jgi:hypothetical protein
VGIDIILEQLAETQQGSMYHLLGIPMDASPGTVRRAIDHLRFRNMDEESLPGQAMYRLDGEMADVAEKILSPENRDNYDAFLKLRYLIPRSVKSDTPLLQMPNRLMERDYARDLERLATAISESGYLLHSLK